VVVAKRRESGPPPISHDWGNPWPSTINSIVKAFGETS